jgi:hypothetical protein
MIGSARGTLVIPAAHAAIRLNDDQRTAMLALETDDPVTELLFTDRVLG